jgi:RNA polymerase sigma factor (sigma-70 family)
MTDSELLRRFVDQRQQEAFAQLVRRHVNLVYAAALRHVRGDRHRAEDITQEVFIDLARKAAALAHHPSLAGWLYSSAHFAAVNAIRREQRRKAREKEADMIPAPDGSPANETDWEQIRPLLDDALQELEEHDRQPVVLRFFGQQTFAAIGEQLGLTENAAQKRVERALDQLNAALTRRGVTSTSVALGVVLTQAGVSAPASLAASVTAVALAGVAGGSAVVGAGVFTFMSTAKFLAGVGVAMIVGTAAGVWYENRVAKAEEKRDAAAVDARVRQLEARIQAESKRAEAAEADVAKLLAAIEQNRTAAATKPAPPPAPRQVGQDPIQTAIQERINEAQKKRAAGKMEEALADYLWAYDKALDSTNAVFAQIISGLIASFGQQYPPALDALRGRRDAVEERLRANDRDRTAAYALAATNRDLKEDARTLITYDALPPGDSRKLILGTIAFDQFIAVQRYADAANAKGFQNMLQEFTAGSSYRQGDRSTTSGEGAKPRTAIIEAASRNIEALAGAGELADAKTLIGKVLAFDSSEATRSFLQQHLSRAGQSGLLAQLPNP